MKKILIDLTFLFDQYSKRGIGRSGKETIRRILALNLADQAAEIHILAFNNLEQNLVQLEISQFQYEDIKKSVVFHSAGKPLPSSLKNIFRWGGWYKPVLNSVEPDVFYAAHFERGLPTAPIFAKSLKFVPKVAVFYPDAIPLAIKDFKFSKKGYLQNLIKKWFYTTLVKGVVNADLVLTCSEFSRNDIIKFVKVDKEKVKTIYLGVDPNFYRENFNFDQGEERTILGLYDVNDKDYFFYDSGVEANKNVDGLLTVFSNLQDDRLAPKHLVIIGGDFTKGTGKKIVAKSPAGTEFLELAKSKNVLDRLITTDSISEQHLKYLLFNAKAYLNLSTYEGFHLGPLQAMAAEVPAIASNTSCTPEVTKGGAFLVDLNNMNLAIRQIREFLHDDAAKADYIKRGKAIAKEYTWDKTAAQTWEALKTLLF